MDFWKDAFVPVVAAAIGTAAGATVAYMIERSKRSREAADRNVTATNNALFALYRIVNDLEGYKRQLLDPHRNDAERWYTLPATRLPAPPKFDTSTLCYLFEIPGDTPSLPMAVQVGFAKYEAAFEVAEMRWQMHMHEVQPALEHARRNVEGNLTIKKLVDTVLGGPRLTDTVEGLTDQLIAFVDDTLDYIPKHADWLRSEAKRKYPKRQIVRLLMRPIDEVASKRNTAGHPTSQ